MVYTSNFLAHESRYREQVSVQKSNHLVVKMLAYDDSSKDNKELGIDLYAFEGEERKKEFFAGTLTELIETVLLGKLYKEQLQAEAKKGA